MRFVVSGRFSTSGLRFFVCFCCCCCSPFGHSKTVYNSLLLLHSVVTTEPRFHLPPLPPHPLFIFLYRRSISYWEANTRLTGTHQPTSTRARHVKHKTNYISFTMRKSIRWQWFGVNYPRGGNHIITQNTLKRVCDRLASGGFLYTFVRKEIHHIYTL